MTDKVLLCSFPKSGSNWVRYCIEYFSGRPTPGSERKLLVHQGEPIIDRTHFLDKRDRPLLRAHCAGRAETAEEPGHRAFARRWLKQLKKEWEIRHLVRSRRVLLLVRNPFDLYVRVRALRPQALAGFASNIAIFDRCRREKLLVYYEDLLRGTAEIGRILAFIGVPHDLARFDLETHRRRSLELYARGPDAPQTADDPLDFGRHARRLDPASREALRQYLLERLGPALYHRYLARYDASARPAETAAE
ncbi:MAG: hypothetical protein RMJ04_14835 [Geminicoccaceae bacterium]|nr:hypothetical protein [Geminicoccaceae bacterium]